MSKAIFPDFLERVDGFTENELLQRTQTAFSIIKMDDDSFTKLQTEGCIRFDEEVLR